ncbi:MAG: hypothetical protein IPN10_02570 [Saprospiraceae bacterium]|nr:hypothetical protein [Saprospiraceae bacterium]
MLREIIRKVVPASLRRKVLTLYWDWLFEKSIKKFKTLKEFTGADERLLRELITGWGNQGYSALTGYTRAFISRGVDNRGDVLDCGSGLSTLLLGIIGDRYGFNVISLEENPQWAEKVRFWLHKLDIKSVNIEVKKGKQYDGYYWYAPSEAVKARKYRLVLLDGPTDHGNNARYGLFPVMIPSFIRGCVILADDFHDPVYKASMLKAENNFNLHITPVAGADPFAVITVES